MKYVVLYLDKVKDEINDLPIALQAKIKVAEEVLAENDTGSLYIKVLRGHIRELIIGEYRLIFFYWAKDKILFVDIFRKKSRKTPFRTIEQAERIYKKLN